MLVADHPSLVVPSHFIPKRMLLKISMLGQIRLTRSIVESESATIVNKTAIMQHGYILIMILSSNITLKYMKHEFPHQSNSNQGDYSAAAPLRITSFRWCWMCIYVYICPYICMYINILHIGNLLIATC